MFFLPPPHLKFSHFFLFILLLLALHPLLPCPARHLANMSHYKRSFCFNEKEFQSPLCIPHNNDDNISFCFISCSLSLSLSLSLFLSLSLLLSVSIYLHLTTTTTRASVSFQLFCPFLSFFLFFICPVHTFFRSLQL